LTLLIEPRADGLAAHLVRLAPGQCHTLAAQHTHGGRFYVVTQGIADVAGEQASSLAVAFAGADEQPALCAGPGGAEVLVLQFPVETPA
jgi:hypothetical protein